VFQKFFRALNYLKCNLTMGSVNPCHPSVSWGAGAVHRWIRIGLKCMISAHSGILVQMVLLSPEIIMTLQVDSKIPLNLNG
jgi:hypothetical protein